MLGALLVSGACGGAGEEGAADSTALPAATATSVTAQVEYDLQGHRGARGLRPENTLPSFEAALDVQVDTLELDLHLTADAVVVVWHDPVIDADKCGLDPAAAAAAPDPDDRATPDEALMISNLTAVELQAYRCDRNPHPGRYPDQAPEPGDVADGDYSIPTLDEVFAFVAAYADSESKSEAQRTNARSVQFNIETKRKPTDPAAIGDEFDGDAPGRFEVEVLAAVDRADVHDRTVVQSFDHRSLWAVRSVDATIGLAALTLDGEIPNFTMLAAQGATIWSPDRRSVTAARLEQAHTAGLAVIPWTVNDPAEMQQLIDLGVDGIITDRPDRAPSR